MHKRYALWFGMTGCHALHQHFVVEAWSSLAVLTVLTVPFQDLTD